MSDIYNPYAFGVLGNPAPLVAPPALRVVSGQATPEQIAMARDVFARFCSGARLSHVPHPAEIGRLSDGSTYRITDVAGNRVMQLWAAGGGGSDSPLPKGIFVVCRNEGGQAVFVFTPGGRYNAPDGAWAMRPADLLEYAGNFPNSSMVNETLTVAPWTNDVWAVDGEAGEYLTRGHNAHYRYGARALVGADGQFSGVVDRGAGQGAVVFQRGVSKVEVTEYGDGGTIDSRLFGLRKNEPLTLPADRFGSVQTPDNWKITDFAARRDGKGGLVAYRTGGVELLPWNGGPEYTQQYVVLDLSLIHI